MGRQLDLAKCCRGPSSRPNEFANDERLAGWGQDGRMRRPRLISEAQRPSQGKFIWPGVAR